jgi:hypothetical protein
MSAAYVFVQTVHHNSTVQNLHTNYRLWLDTKVPNLNCKTRNMLIVNFEKRFDEWNFWWSWNWSKKIVVKVARLKQNCSEISIFVIRNELFSVVISQVESSTSIDQFLLMKSFIFDIKILIKYQVSFLYLHINIVSQKVLSWNHIIRHEQQMTDDAQM